MTIEIHRPELEALIRERMASGAYASVEDVILQALRRDSAEPVEARSGSAELLAKDIVELFAPLRGENLDFSRNPSGGRSVAL